MSERTQLFSDHLAYHHEPAAGCYWCPPAPAVPVGVQPASEAARRPELPAYLARLAVPPDEPEPACTVCGGDERGHQPGEFVGPAVPVVHPEPGDRAEHRPIAASLYDNWRCRCGWNGEDFWEHIADVRDAAVAAAVAAVRADRDRLAGQVAAIRDKLVATHAYDPDNALWAEGYNACIHDLAALVASSPTTPEADS